MNLSAVIAYRQIEEEMRLLAESEGDVFLPNPEPEPRVKYVLICMEPSLGGWASSKEDARAKVAAGFLCFFDFILHFCVRRYLCAPGERYHITDLSKGAMLTKHANEDRFRRYDRWYPLLREELRLVSARDARVVAVGSVVEKYLNTKPEDFPDFAKVIHYSALAGAARDRAVRGREEEFQAFSKSFTLDDLLAVTNEVLEAAHVSPVLRDKELDQLSRRPLTTSRLKLAFAYKVAFAEERDRRSTALGRLRPHSPTGVDAVPLFYD
jgi:hypothetical protein